jgi:divalent metal cation (Fe/Co/Zn/Cd) transporter
MGYFFVLEMHVEVNPKMSVAASHELAHQVKDAIQARLTRVHEVVIHIEPHRPEP